MGIFSVFSVESLLGFSMCWAITPCELEQEAPLWFTPHPLPAAARIQNLLSEQVARAKCGLTLTLSGRVSACSRPRHKGQMLSASAFQIGNGSHPLLMNILSLDDKLGSKNVCQVIIKYSPTERCRVLPMDVGNVNLLCCAAVRQTKSRARAVSDSGTH